MALSRPGQGHLAMLCFSLIVSFSFTFGHMVAGKIAPEILTLLRLGLASCVLLVAAKLRGFAITQIFRGFWRWMLVGALMALYFITMFEALRLTSAVSTSAVFTLTPLLAAGIGFMIAGQRLLPWSLLALCVGAAGALWVIFRGDLAALMSFDLGRGEAIFLMGAIAHAAVPTLVRQFSRGDAPLLTSTATTIGAFLSCALYVVATGAAFTTFTSDQAVVLVILYLAIAATAGTFFLIQYAAPRLPAGKVMAYTYLVPTWVVLWDWLIYGRPPQLSVLIGSVLTLSALFMLLRGKESG